MIAATRGADRKPPPVAHAGGNFRTLTVMADALLAADAEHDREVLDEKLFIETSGEPAHPLASRLIAGRSPAFRRPKRLPTAWQDNAGIEIALVSEEGDVQLCAEEALD